MGKTKKPSQAVVVSPDSRYADADGGQNWQRRLPTPGGGTTAEGENVQLGAQILAPGLQAQAQRGEARSPAAASAKGKIEGSFIPQGCDAEGAANGGDVDDSSPGSGCYEDSMVRGFWCPPRLRGRNESLVEAANDWHFAMLNDSNRNQFYLDALGRVAKGKRVLDVGAGSGLLSMMASRQGAKDVLAIEASKDMVDLARINIKKNDCANIRILHNLSNHVVLGESEKADVVVSETLGALMLSEGMLDYLSDARRRLAKPGATIIPAGGSQHAMLISSPSLAMVTSVQPQCSSGFDLSAIGSLQDTGNLFFTKQWGFRLNSLPDVVQMSERVQILEVDFASTERTDIKSTRTYKVEALQDGVIHAVVASWEVWADKDRSLKISTHPEDTRDTPWGFARDMQWGQGLQLVEDVEVAQRSDRNTPPQPFKVKAGEMLLLTVRFSTPCRQTFQFTLTRAPPAATAAVKPSNGSAVAGAVNGKANGTSAPEPGSGKANGIGADETESGKANGTSAPETESGNTGGASAPETESGKADGTSATETEPGKADGTSATGTEPGHSNGTSGLEAEPGASN